MNSTLTLLCIIFIISFLSIALDIRRSDSGHSEGFLNPDNYPISVEKPLLRGFYKEKKNPRITDNESKDIYKNYPVFPASCTTNNNIRYWKTPNNGTCEPAEFCGGLYEPTIHPIPKPPLPPKWDNGMRVNYYESSKYCE